MVPVGAAAHSAVVAMVPLRVNPSEDQKKSLENLRNDAADVFRPGAYSLSSSYRLRRLGGMSHY